MNTACNHRYKGFTYALVEKGSSRFWHLRFTPKRVDLLIPDGMSIELATEKLHEIFDQALSRQGLTRFRKKDFYSE